MSKYTPPVYDQTTQSFHDNTPDSTGRSQWKNEVYKHNLEKQQIDHEVKLYEKQQYAIRQKNAIDAKFNAADARTGYKPQSHPSAPYDGRGKKDGGSYQRATRPDVDEPPLNGNLPGNIPPDLLHPRMDGPRIPGQPPLNAFPKKGDVDARARFYTTVARNQQEAAEAEAAIGTDRKVAEPENGGITGWIAGIIRKVVNFFTGGEDTPAPDASGEGETAIVRTERQAPDRSESRLGGLPAPMLPAKAEDRSNSILS